MISRTSIVSFNDTRHNIVETEAESHDNRLGSLLALANRGQVIWLGVLKAAYGGGVVFFQYLL